MTDKINDGGPAFPATVQGWNDRLSQAQGGMTLRDWFAGQALVGIMACPRTEIGGPIDAALRQMADLAFQSADAMLAERAKLADATP